MKLIGLIGLINSLSSLLDFAFFAIPFYFVLSKWDKFYKASFLSLLIIRWALIVIASINLIFWLKEFAHYWFNGIDQYALYDEQVAFYNRALGEYWYLYWIMQIGNTIFPLLLLINYFGKRYFWVFAFLFFFKFGIFMERSIIILTSFHRDFLQSNWTYNHFELELIWIFKAIIFTMNLLLIAIFINYVNQKFRLNKKNLH